MAFAPAWRPRTGGRFSRAAVPKAVTNLPSAPSESASADVREFVDRLRGYGAFRSLFQQGRRHRCNAIICQFTAEPARGEDPVITVGFASARTRTKVARNRNIRILRELFRHSHQILLERCLAARIRVRMVLLLDLRPQERAAGYESLKSDIVSLFKSLPLDAQ